MVALTDHQKVRLLQALFVFHREYLAWITPRYDESTNCIHETICIHNAILLNLDDNQSSRYPAFYRYLRHFFPILMSKVQRRSCLLTVGTQPYH